MAVWAMKKGAVEFLSKPFRDDDLLSAIRDALAQAQTSHQEESEIGDIRRRYALLTSREKEGSLGIPVEATRCSVSLMPVASLKMPDPPECVGRNASHPTTHSSGA